MTASMIADDPFTDEEFRDRLGKLLRMLGSDQGAEADAARRKLLEHLAQHGATLSDLTAHLGDAPEAAPDAIAREALHHAEQRAQRAEQARSAAEGMNARLLRRVDRAGRQIWTAWASAGVLAAVLGGAGLLYLFNEIGGGGGQAATVQQIAPRVSDAVLAQNRAALPPPGPQPEGARTAAEWIGTVDLSAELLDEANSAAQRRAMLDPGMRVLVLQSGPVWLRVRTERGDGYVLKGLVRPDRG